MSSPFRSGFPGTLSVNSLILWTALTKEHSVSRFPVTVVVLSLLVSLTFAACTSPPDLQLLSAEKSPLEVSKSNETLRYAPGTTTDIPATATIEVQTMRTLFRFDSTDTAGRWAIVNDSVME
jgi:hypothetical protein